jgi:hypothetical protein
MSAKQKNVVLLILIVVAAVLVVRMFVHCPYICPVKPIVGPNQPVEKTAAKPAGKMFIEFNIQQDKNLISLATFSEPPQMAIWLEEPVSHKYKTIYVSYRTGTGDMVGKAECPGCLPLWFEIYNRETGKKGYPKPDNPAPAAVTGATPQEEKFKIVREIEPDSKWICWMEMNLAGDFNEKYQEYNAEAKTADDDFSGQPPLVYRCEIEVIAGKKYVPALYGQVDMRKPFEQMIQPVSPDVTTAKEVFKSIEISISTTEPNQPK